MSKTYMLGAVSLNGKAEAAIMRDSFGISPQLQADLLHASGEARPSFAGTLTSRPTVTFQTANLNFLNLATALSGGGFAVSLIEQAVTGEAGATAISYAAVSGLAVPEKITAQAGSVATLDVSVYPVSSDGVAAPLAAGTTKTPPGRITGNVYTLGGFKIGTTEFNSVQQSTINFGYNVVTNEGENGATYPTLARIDRHTPEVSVTFRDISQLAAAHILTGEVPAGAVTLYFSQVVEGGVTVPKALAVTLGRSFVDATGLQSGNAVSGVLRFRPLIPASGDFFAFGSGGGAA